MLLWTTEVKVVFEILSDETDEDLVGDFNESILELLRTTASATVEKISANTRASATIPQILLFL